MYCLKQHFVLSFLFFEVKAQKYFVSSRNMFLDEKTVLKIGLILGYTQPSFQELGPVL